MKYLSPSFFAILLLVNVLQSQPKEICILHTNDIHAAFVPHKFNGGNSAKNRLIGGFLELEWVLDSIKQTKTSTLILDGGDVMTGNPISDITYKNSIGGALFEMMNMIGYDAWTIGNHDLDVSQENFKLLTRIAKFPTLCANLVDTSGNYCLNNYPFKIFERNGLRTGVVGIISNDLFSLTNTKNLKGLKVSDALNTMQQMVDSLDSITDIIIGLSHQGYPADSILAEQVKHIDVIIGSHSHTRIESPKFINGVIICQAGSNCEYLGELNLAVENDSVVSYKGKIHPLWVRHRPKDSNLKQMVEYYKEMIKSEYDIKIGYTSVPFKRSRTGESIIGTYFADAVREVIDADVGIINSSSLRKDILQGDITKLNIYEVIPFRNYICAFKIRGTDLRKIIKKYVESLKEGRVNLNISNVRGTWKRGKKKASINKIYIGQEILDDNKIFTVGTIDYVLDQAARYLGFIPDNIEKTNYLFFDVIVDYIKRNKIIGNLYTPNFKEE